MLYIMLNKIISIFCKIIFIFCKIIFILCLCVLVAFDYEYLFCSTIEEIHAQQYKIIATDLSIVDKKIENNCRLNIIIKDENKISRKIEFIFKLNNLEKYKNIIKNKKIILYKYGMEYSLEQIYKIKDDPYYISESKLFEFEIIMIFINIFFGYLCCFYFKKYYII
jgi:hypothetical protein